MTLFYYIELKINHTMETTTATGMINTVAIVCEWSKKEQNCVHLVIKRHTFCVGLIIQGSEVRFSGPAT